MGEADGDRQPNRAEPQPGSHRRQRLLRLFQNQGQYLSLIHICIGSTFAFGLKGGLAAGKKLLETVRLFSHVTNVGDTRSIITHPGSTTHQQMSEADQIAAGVNPELIRLSIGLEDPEDLIADLAQAMK